MPILKEIGNDLNKKARRKVGRKSMLILSDSEEEDDYDTALQIMESNKGTKLRKKQSLCLDEEDDDDEESDGYLSPLDKEKENVNPKEDGKFSKRKQHPDSVKKTASGVKDVKLDTKTPNPKPKKVRRRSSARFLRLSGRFNDEDDEGMDETPEEEQREKLNEMYSKAIQLNAANKINAVNSWGLNIIDKMDKFLGDDEDDNGTSPNVVENLPVDDVADSAVKEKRVNFTKASCTIDACVKIYSYRVDDAHLTSYKVLANLNRTDGGKDVEKSGLRTNDESLSDSEERNSLQRTTNQKRLDRNTEAKTIESNIGKNTECNLDFFPVENSSEFGFYCLSCIPKANLNISKLDSAYDIDPIFHKMSQKFDEGGAKGLLLVNLGVANDGCRIVLDSKEERDAVSSMEPELINETNDEVEPPKEGMVDISNLSKILESKLNDRAIESIELVPQLSELRQMYAVLEEEGYVEASKNLNLEGMQIMLKRTKLLRKQSIVRLWREVRRREFNKKLVFCFLIVL
jgi:Chromosome condensation complex Condensin, subunit H